MKKTDIQKITYSIFQTILGKKVERPAKLDETLFREIISFKEPADDFQIIPGKTMCADDFYEGKIVL